VQLVQDVEEVFQSLDHDISRFKHSSGLHCKVGCGKCCLKPDIEATVLEFIPFAYQLYMEGKALQWLDNPNLDQSICAVLDTNSQGIGQCSSYVTRGLICRLFGFSARLNKYGHKEFVTCQVIKLEQPEEFAKAYEDTKAGIPVPLMRDYYMRLRSIDSTLGEQFYPINVAIRRAIETVLQHFSYQEEQGVTIH